MRDAEQRDQETLNRLVDLSRNAVDERLNASGADRGLAHLIATARARAAVPSRRRSAFFMAGSGLAVAGGLALLIVGVVRWGAPSTASLSYAVETIPAAASEPATGAAPTAAARPTAATTPAAIAPAPTSQVRFSDGTTIATASGTAVDVEAVDQRRPRVRINGKAARVRVVHRPDTRWTFEAGPFEVLVTGTAFDLGWNPAPQVLSLNLIEGAVILRGPRLPADGIPVLAGQRVEVSLATGSLTVHAAGAGASPMAAAGTPTADQHPFPTEGPAPPASSAAPLPGRHGGGVSWRELVARGDFEGVVKAARKRSIDDCEARCSVDELRALGDAARYSNRFALAERAFVALRARFAGTTDGAAAAYLLGRTYESKHNWASAQRLYTQYLTEAPSGQFSVEAASGRARVAAHQ